MNRDNEGNKNIPEQDPSNAMDSKAEVERSGDEKTDQDFPGYPHYPGKEDIMDQRTDNHKVDMDVEKLAAGPNASGLNQRFLSGQDRQRAEDAMTPQPGYGKENMQEDLDAQLTGREGVTSDDLAALNGKNEEIGTPQNISNEDLNKKRPGTDLDEARDND
jgi:hypothetical protein